MYLGIDSSTQSLSAMIIDPANAEIVGEASVNFGKDLSGYQSPSGFLPHGKNGEVHANPLMWLDALDKAMKQLSERFDLKGIRMIGGSGQQHGSVYLNESFQRSLENLSSKESLSAQLKPCLSRATSPIWMDTSTGEECKEIAAAIGSDLEVCALSGSETTERFTGPQIRKFHKADSAGYQETAQIHLVSSFIASVLAGAVMPIDHGDGAGMNLLNLKNLKWDAGLLNATAPNLGEKLPPLSSCLKNNSQLSGYFVEKYGFSPSCRVAPFTGDNPASLVGMGATTPGKIVVSLGTSDTFFAAMPGPKTDPNGYGHVFGNPAGGFMSLICFRNGSLAREALRDELGVDWDAFEKTALNETISSAGENITLPFFGSEITPRGEFTTPVREFSEEETPARKIRSLLEGQFINMRVHSSWMGVQAEQILLTGGAAKNDGIAQVVADVFGVPVERLEIENSAALGAALIAAAADGGDLEALQKDFCKPLSGSRLEPNPQTSSKYSTAMVAFEKLLGKYLP